MNHYITGQTIKTLRENLKITQLELGNMLGVSDKTVSKWETSKGLPDVTLIEPLAKALHVSVMELLSGEAVTNRNRSSNLLRSHFYVCPLCGYVIHTTGETLVSCCGITLPPLEAEEDTTHQIQCERIDDYYHVTLEHEMTKTHYISFLAYVF